MNEILSAQSDVERIKKALHEIEDPYKEVFMWRVFADLSFRQIGQMFGKTENWACVTYHRAKSKIQKKLEENSNG
jgi:RNA polymerase sigma-70 factor (ECF subfamily)